MIKNTKITVVLTTFIFAFIANMGIAFAKADDHKLRVKNYSPYKVQVKWYCKNKLKDRDVFPPGTTLRKMSRSKCAKDNDVSIELAYDWTMTSWLGKPSWYGTWIYAKPNAYTSNVKGRLLYQVKHSKLATYKGKKCLMVTSDPTRMAVSLAFLNVAGVATSALAVAGFDCGGLE